MRESSLAWGAHLDEAHGGALLSDDSPSLVVLDLMSGHVREERRIEGEKGGRLW